MCSIHMSKILYTCQIVCLLFLVGGLSCSAFQCPVDVGSIARELLARFSAPDDSLRYRAAEYLLEGLPYQWHYDVKKLDETGIKVKVMDVEVLDAEYLAENIEYAFRAWELPWARDLSFKDFCRYLLPYKMGNEAPERWRAAVWNEFSWVLEQADRTTDATAVCRWIDDYVNSWYTVNLDYNYPADAGYLKAKEIRQGTCQGASLMVMYPLRALGVAATYDYVPQWGNRSGRHNWNALYDHGYLRTFNGPDRNPGEHKVEFIGVGRMYFRRPKIYRKEYLNAGSVDVTSEYLPSVDVSVPMRGARNGDVHLAVFDNSNWRSVCEGRRCGNRAVFDAMAREIVYLPIIVENEKGRPFGLPFVVGKDGRVHTFRAGLHRRSVSLTSKYPEDESNRIFPGERYELFCWRGYWRSLGEQEASDTVLVYDNVPAGALLWLRNLDKGVQERIFVYEDGKQIWY